MNEWSKGFYGVSHYGKASVKNYWSTINVYDDFVILLKWFPGCGFSPIEEMYQTIEDAKCFGEKWVNDNQR